MAPFHVRSKVCIAPINVRRKFADFSPHMEGSKADFALHMEWRHIFRNQNLLSITITQITFSNPLYFEKFYDLYDHF